MDGVNHSAGTRSTLEGAGFPSGYKSVFSQHTYTYSEGLERHATGENCTEGGLETSRSVVLDAKLKVRSVTKRSRTGPFISCMRC